MTATQLHAKRHERTLLQREKRRNRIRARAQQAEANRLAGIKRGQWLRSLVRTQQANKNAMDEAHRQALESRRTKSAMPGHGQNGLVSRFKAFFRRTP